MPQDTEIVLRDKELFKKKVIEIYDPIHIQRYWFARVKNEDQFDKLLMDLIPNCASLVEFNKETEEGTDGECVDLVLNGRMIIVLWCRTDSINAIVHECLHAVLMSCKSRGINVVESNDSACYMLGFLVEELFKHLKLGVSKKS